MMREHEVLLLYHSCSPGIQLREADTFREDLSNVPGGEHPEETSEGQSVIFMGHPPLERPGFWERYGQVETRNAIFSRS